MPSATHTAVAIMRGTCQGIIREEFDNQDDEGDKYCQRYDRNERMWFHWLLRWAGNLLLSNLSFLFIFFLFHLLILSYTFHKDTIRHLTMPG